MAENSSKYYQRIAKRPDDLTIDLMIANFKEAYGLSQQEMEILVSLTPPGELYRLLSAPTEDGADLPLIEKALARLRLDHEVNRAKVNMRVVRRLRNKLAKLILPESDYE